MRLALLLIFIFTFSFCGAIANDEYSVVRITPYSDIPVSEISRIHFGNKGLLWIGTNKGLYYYDGYNYGSLQSMLFSKNSLSDDNILDLSQDDAGNIWLLTEFGIEKFTIQPRELSSIKAINNATDVNGFVYSPDNQSLYITYPNYIISFSVESNQFDTIYISQEGISVKPKLIKDKLCFFEKNKYVEISLSNNEITKNRIGEIANIQTTAIEILDSVNLLFAIDKELYRYNRSNLNFVKIAEFPNYILHLSEITDRQVAVSTINKLFSVRIDTIQTATISHLATMPEAIVQNIVLDKNGLLWVATNKDVLKINPYSKAFLYTPFLQDYINYPLDSKIIFESNHRGVLFGDSSGDYFYFNSENNEYYSLPINECTAVNYFNNKLYIGQSDRLLSINLSSAEVSVEKSSLHVNHIKTIDNKLWVTSHQGVYLCQGDSIQQICSEYTKDIFIQDNVIFLVTQNGLGRLNQISGEFETLILAKSYSDESILNDILYSYDGKLWIATDNGLYQFIHDSTKSIEEQFVTYFEGAVYSLIEASNSPEIWFSTDNGIGMIDYSTGKSMLLGVDDGIVHTPFLKRGTFTDIDSNIVFITGKQAVRFNPDKIFRRTLIPKVFISKATFYSDKTTHESILYSSDTLLILPHIRYFELELSTLDYYSPNTTEFEYSLEPEEEALEWRSLYERNKLSIGRLSPGKYDLFIKAKNNHGLESVNAKRLTLIVKAPLLQTKGAFLGYFVTLILMVVLLIRIRTRNLMRINREYKEKEIIARKIELQKEELIVKNKNITDSINYARRIQLAMMPSVKMFSSIFTDSFVLHMPKDIVSGDFYWVNQVANKTFFSAVDCTGHGVPGAFMSIIGVELFRRITEIEKTTTPAEILNSMSRNFGRVFGDVDEMKLRDGMDLAFCTLNKEHTELEYAGAFNPLYIIRDSSIMEIKGDRNSVGVYEEGDLVRSFNNHVIPLQDGDIIYIFTDGFADQFGGPEGKKYKYRRFRHLLLALHQLPVEKQRDFLRENILEWKGELDQVDDILVMGIRIHQKKKE